MRQKANRLLFGPAHILTLSFAGVILLGTLFLKLPFSTIKSISLVDALFTATSAVCVTGLAVRNTMLDFTLTGQIVILTLIQIGGLGLMTFTAIFIWMLRERISLTERLTLEYAFLQDEKMRSLRSFIYFVIAFTFITEAIGAVGFFITMDEPDLLRRIYFSIFHAVSAFCNAGFSLYSDSLMRYRANFSINAVTMSLIIAGGMGFVVVYETITRLKALVRHEVRYKTPRFSLHTSLALRTTLILIIAGAALLFVLERITGGSLTGLESLFLSVTSRTAGFNTVDLGLLHESTLLMVILLMFIGGSPGSCAGGIKTTTAAALFYLAFLGRDNFEEVTARGRTIPKAIIYQALLIFMFSLGIVIISTMLLTIFDQSFGLMRNLFEVVSAFGTVGLSTGITPKFTDASKLVLIATMFCGRVGSLTIFSIMAGRKAIPLRYAEERILVG